jgi:hypothetical protein
MRPERRLGAVLMALALAVGCLRCTLDFDRYSPGAGGADAQPDQSGMHPTHDAANADTGALDAGSAEAQGPCPTSQSCLMPASSCAMGCRMQSQHCNNRCQGDTGCMMGCQATEQSCGGQCTTMCITCANNASCTSPTAQSDCLEAGSP